MELQLKYQPKQLHNITGAFISGKADIWLNEISSWEIDPLTVRIFYVTEHISSNQCAGIFVIFDGEVPATQQIRKAYGNAAPGFFLPINATLYPAIESDELNKLKLWDIQLFHPHIGLVGFENKDAFSLADLIELPERDETSWLTDLPEAQPVPQLHSIMLELQEQTDPIADFQQSIDAKPLDDIPKNDAETTNTVALWRKITSPLTQVGLWLLLILMLIGKYIMKALSFLFPKGTHTFSNSTKPSLWQKFEKWLDQQMASIEKQRDTALNRLVKLFDKDDDLALQYAIPLNSTYENRGVAPRSGKLSWQRLDLNFRGFGSGGAADVWDLGNYRWELQQRYERAAIAAIDRGNFKKAAYIYAHLLGDFNRAAETLQLGKHYREAATIYKDHVKNKNKAAQCLENGGLLGEAITLYLELENYEKAADLYQQIGQTEKAMMYYEEEVRRALTANDNLSAAKLIAHKIGDQERSQLLLLQGWKDNNQADECLKRYLETKQKEEVSLKTTVRSIFEQHVGNTRSTRFLSVVAQFVNNSKDDELDTEALSICYEIVNRQAANGDFSAMKLMPSFMPADQMIIQDTNRYAVYHARKVPLQQAEYHFQLNEQIKWIDFCSFHDQLIGIGSMDGDVQLLRMDWEGNISYTYLFKANEQEDYRLIGDAGVSGDLYLVSENIDEKHHKLEITEDFQRGINLYQVNWIDSSTIAVALTSVAQTLTCLQTFLEEFRINEKASNGRPLSTNICFGDIDQIQLFGQHSTFVNMYARNQHFYFATVDSIIRLEKTGLISSMKLEGQIISSSISGVHAALKIATLTEYGCVIVTPMVKEMVVSIPFFGKELEAYMVQLLPDQHVVLANAQKAQVFDISKKKAVLLFEVISDTQILKILPVPKRHQFALLESDHKIHVHLINS